VAHVLLVRALLMAGQCTRAFEVASGLLSSTRAGTISLTSPGGGPWMGEDPVSGAPFPSSVGLHDIVTLMGQALLGAGDDAGAARLFSVVIQVRGAGVSGMQGDSWESPVRRQPCSVLDVVPSQAHLPTAPSLLLSSPPPPPSSPPPPHPPTRSCMPSTHPPRQENDSHVDALRLYGRMCRARGDLPTALHIFLKLVVVVTKHKDVRRCLAEVIGGPGGLSALREQLSPSAEGASAAYAFLAVILKVRQAVQGWGPLPTHPSHTQTQSPSTTCLTVVHPVMCALLVP
jgi:hypothetical protein